MCEKRNYPNRSAALVAAEQQERNLRAYLCEDCGHWHLSSKGQIADRSRRKRNFMDADVQRVMELLG